MLMKIPLDRQAKQPIYLQIRDRIHHLIHTGHLPPNSQLPSIRALAQTTQVNKLTVIEAYSVLEADGLVQAKQGAGYFITPSYSRAKLRSLSSNGHQDQQLSKTIDYAQRRFNPAQQVILPTKGVYSFPDIYSASLRSHNRPDYIDFGLGFPQASDVEDLQRISRRAMKSAHTFFQPGDPQGNLELRNQIVQILLQQGLEISPEDLIVTSGSMQSLSLLANHYVMPGDRVVVEAPTYHGVLSIFQQRRAQVIGIPMTAEGMNLDLLAQYLESHRPKLIYTISTLHNPTGITTSAQHRRQLLALAEAYSCLVIEDNAYEPLSFGTTPPPIKAFDNRGSVVYVGTFSKTLMPGLRVGYMAVTSNDCQSIVERKLLHDLHVSAASQAIVKEYLASGHYRRRLTKIKRLHRDRRDYMIDALIRHFPLSVTWTVPDGGTFLWIQLPNRIDLELLCRAAAERKVLVGSGAAFFPKEQGYPALRLNFSLPSEETERGVRILGEILHIMLEQ
ncbi:aminotransferase, classes I and II superfamily [Synechococcus sp. PCC 7335]|uniref:aminotransferase-like domain-containing protein n=1 Tax=Synechococcus sp. (strain ATCC 29403 / PCC 7335) TaxID=91464 RepID=UPI00017EE031|nr:PLP-dependent aminotransferase family protein [Synechococcus sp. PCC 7335]EDX87626.1 aminotransferase, classes I and II superfamily [Synechococcus sp. PCC 7335]